MVPNKFVDHLFHFKCNNINYRFKFLEKFHQWNKYMIPKKSLVLMYMFYILQRDNGLNEWLYLCGHVILLLTVDCVFRQKLEKGTRECHVKEMSGMNFQRKDWIYKTSTRYECAVKIKALNWLMTPSIFIQKIGCVCRFKESWRKRKGLHNVMRMSWG